MKGGIAFDVDTLVQKRKDLEKELTQPDIWDDRERVTAITREIKRIKAVTEPWIDIKKRVDDLYELYSLAVEEQETELEPELSKGIKELSAELDKIEKLSLFTEESDESNAYLTIHSGAGGTEACDWVSMLLRMYLRWMENSGFKSDIVDILPGEEAGIKSVTVYVRGLYAYGYLKTEIGIHRLVRISPFDANKRRHTSFASVFVYPEVDDNIEVEINENDLRIDTYRASGAGGQHVNKVSSAVRITHIPTGIVAQCQSERSQLHNKDNAMKVLKSRLYQMYKEEQDKERQKIENEKKSIEWGNQIRSYVFQPYSMVKDHRTDEQTGNVQAVMDGNIDQFIDAFLKNKSLK